MFNPASVCKSSISIKTRIETKDNGNIIITITSKSSISIKTRIETLNNHCEKAMVIFLIFENRGNDGNKAKIVGCY